MKRSALQDAKRFLKRRKFSAAISVLESHETEYPEEFEYLLTMGIAHLYVGVYGSARTYFQRARNIRVNDPEHAYLHDIGRAEYVPVTDEEAVNAFEYLARTEGIIPAIESAHAIAYAMKLAPETKKDRILVITLSGRGDKDCAAIARYRGEDLHE